MTKNVDLKWISGFWRGVGALLIDTLVLGVVGFVLGLAFESVFVRMGAWGRLIGFAIALVYFGVMNSKVSGGQTLGKKFLKLRVVNSINAPISVGKSILRYIILATPFSLNGAHFSNEAIPAYLIYPLSFIVAGGLFSIFYLYIFNRVTRQSLHDLMVGTFVVNTDIEKHEVGKVWKIHFIIVAFLFVVAGLAPAFTAQFVENQPLKDMLTAQVALSNMPYVSYVNVSSSTTTFSSINKESNTTSYVKVRAFLSHANISDAKFAGEIAAVLITHYPEVRNKDAIQIILTYGYDIGIGSKWLNRTYSFDPDELQSTEECEFYNVCI